MVSRSKQQPESVKAQILRDVYEHNVLADGSERSSRKTANPAGRRTSSRGAKWRLRWLVWLVGAVALHSGAFAYWNLSKTSSVPDVSERQTVEQAADRPDPARVAVLGFTPLAANHVAQERPAEMGPDLELPASGAGAGSMFDSDIEPAHQLQSLASPGIPLAQLFGLRVKTIVIDAGHGGKDPGATGALGIHEKAVTLDIAKRLRERLQAYGRYKVLMTRETDQYLSLNERVEYANTNHADLFVSVHINVIPGMQENFIETFYFGPTSDNKVAKLAAYENAESEYRYTEFKGMVEKIGDTMKFQESKELARTVQRSLYSNIHGLNKKAKNYGIKAAPFVVLLGVDAPSILAEVTSLNNEQEEKRLQSPAYRDKIAMFLEKGIVRYLNQVQPPGEDRNGEEKEKLAQAHD